MTYSTEAQYAEAFPGEFLVGVSLAKQVMEKHPDASRDYLEETLFFEIAEWAIANSPDLASPHIVSQETAVELGAQIEIESRTGARV